MTEKWMRWEPLSGIPEKMYFNKLQDDINETLLILESEDGNTKVNFTFDGSVVAMRSFDESRYIKTLKFLTSEYGTDFYGNWTLFKIKNSEFEKWINEESYNIYSEDYIEHYIFLAADYIVEILATEEPVIKINEND